MYRKLALIGVIIITVSACDNGTPSNKTFKVEINSDKMNYRVGELINISVVMRNKNKNNYNVNYENLTNLFYVDQSGETFPIVEVADNGQPVINAGVGIQTTWEGNSNLYEMNNAGKLIKEKFTIISKTGQYKIFSMEKFSIINNSNEKEYSIKSNEVTINVK